MQRTIFKIKQNQVSLRTARSQFFGKLKQPQNYQTFSVSQRSGIPAAQERCEKVIWELGKMILPPEFTLWGENLDLSIAHGKGYIRKFPINSSYSLQQAQLHHEPKGRQI